MQQTTCKTQHNVAHIGLLLTFAAVWFVLFVELLVPILMIRLDVLQGCDTCARQRICSKHGVSFMCFGLNNVWFLFK